MMTIAKKGGQRGSMRSSWGFKRVSKRSGWASDGAGRALEPAGKASDGAGWASEMKLERWEIEP